MTSLQKPSRTPQRNTPQPEQAAAAPSAAAPVTRIAYTAYTAHTAASSYRHHGYRYIAEVAAPASRVRSLRHYPRRFRHWALLPDGTKTALPYPQYWVATRKMFTNWVDEHRGAWVEHVDGYVYTPERTNRWISEFSLYRHRMIAPDGTCFEAPFSNRRRLPPDVIALWLRFGMPQPVAFNRKTLSVTLLRQLRDVAEEWNVADDQLDTLIVLHVFKTKG